jgi:hypothetical protein
VKRKKEEIKLSKERLQVWREKASFHPKTLDL